MTKPNLSGKNTDGRIAGVGSTPTALTTKKTKLWRKLRELDRKIGEILKLRYRYSSMDCESWPPTYRLTPTQVKKRFEDLDEKRKIARKALKDYCNNERMA